jgi:putative tryptophan/tyrosine transport system substrate-binding protein
MILGLSLVSLVDSFRAIWDSIGTERKTRATARRPQQASAPVIGFLSSRSPDESAHLLAAFHRGLNENGYVERQNLTIEYRWAAGDYHRLPTLAVELAGRPLTVLVSVGGQPAALVAKSATSTIPIIANFSADPAGSGLVANLNRPSGNITGISSSTATLEPRRLGLLRELVPEVATVGVLVNASNAQAAMQLREMREAAQVTGIHLHILRASTDHEIDAAFDSVAQHQIPALAVASDAFFNMRRDKLAVLATRCAVPAIYSFRDYAKAGGLMSYGIELSELYRQLGVYASRVLKGSKLSDLPVVQPTKFELLINMKSARVLGIEVAPTLLARADELIE